MTNHEGQIGEDQIVRLERKLQNDPASPLLLVALGAAYCERGKKTRGLQFLEKATLKDPRNATILLVAGRALFQLGRFREAEKVLLRGSQMGQNADFFLWLGLARARLGENDRSIDAYRRALEIDPGCVAALINLAIGLRLRDPAALGKSKALIIRARRADPQDPIAHRELGYLAMRAGRFDAARSNLAKALELDPDDAWTQLYSGLAHQKLGRPEEAESNYRRAIELAPQWADAYGLAGSFYLAFERWDDAERMYRQQLALAPHSPSSVKQLGKLLVRRGKLAEGHALLLRVLKADLDAIRDRPA